MEALVDETYIPRQWGTSGPARTHGAIGRPAQGTPLIAR